MNSEKKRKTADLLSICIKAGRAVKGFDSAKEAVAGGKAFCVLIAADTSPKTAKEIRFYCEKANVPVYEVPLEKSDIGRLCGKDTAVLAVCDEGFARGFGNHCNVDSFEN